MPREEREHKAARDRVEEQALQGVEKVLFRGNRTEKVDLITDPIVFNIAARMVDCTALKIRDLHTGIRPDRGCDAPRLNRLN